MLDMHGSVRTAKLSLVFSATSLNACLNGFLQWRALPLTGVNIEDTAGLNGEVLVAREYPTAVVPRPDGVLVQPAQERTAVESSGRTAALNMLHQITEAPTGETADGNWQAVHTPAP